MFSNLVKMSFLVILSVASVSNAYLVPGETHEDSSYAGDSFGGDFGGIGAADDGSFGDQHALCDNPYDPNCSVNNNPGHGGHNGGGNHGQNGQSQIKSIYINRTVWNESINLGQLAGIGSQYRGWEVVAVTARTRPNSNNTTIAHLVADGRIVDSQTNPGHRIDLRPNQRLIIGNTVRVLELVINGSTNIDTIEIQIVRNSNGGGQQPPPYNPNPPQYPGHPYPGQPGHGSERLQLNIHRSVYGSDRIDLNQYIDTNRYYGRRIEQVIVTGAAHNNVSLADLLVNGFNAGTLQFDGYTRSQSLRLNNRPDIGGSAGSLVLYTRGNMNVDTVTLVLGY